MVVSLFMQAALFGGCSSVDDQRGGGRFGDRVSPEAAPGTEEDADTSETSDEDAASPDVRDSQTPMDAKNKG